jgi:hypothetical protein
MSCQPALPNHLRQLLQRLGTKLAGDETLQPELALVVDQLNALEPAAISRIEIEIRTEAGLWSSDYRRSSGLSGWWRGLFRSRTPRQLENGWEYLFLFHGDGYRREAALDRIRGAIPSAFLFVAIAWRLNDWAPQVRDAARACALCAFAATDAGIVVDAALFLLDHARSWQRWHNEKQVLLAAFQRPDVAELLAARLKIETAGALSATLRFALRQNILDRYLPDLAANATSSAIRAMALRALIDGRAKWVGGWQKEWIEKPMGRYRMVPRLADRVLDCAVPPLRDLLRQAANDRSPIVRKLAAIALLEHGSQLDGMDEMIDRLSRDSSASVRSRIEFLQRSKASA